MYAIYIYMVTFTIHIPQMLAYIAYMDPMGIDNGMFTTYQLVITGFRWLHWICFLFFREETIRFGAETAGCWMILRDSPKFYLRDL